MPVCCRKRQLTEDDLALVRGRVLHRQQDRADAHERDRAHGAPLAADLVAQVADGDHSTDDAHDLDVLGDLQQRQVSTSGHCVGSRLNHSIVATK